MYTVTKTVHRFYMEDPRNRLKLMNTVYFKRCTFFNPQNNITLSRIIQKMVHQEQ